jgi:DNA mismatch repair protein MutS
MTDLQMHEQPESTPLRRQYLDVKRRYPHAILFFRLGDFYETFDDDARTCARELDITLTARPIGKNRRIPLAGVPHHAIDGHIARLLSRGYKVAVCDQVGEASGRKMIERQVTRVLTPGTLIDDGCSMRAGTTTWSQSSEWTTVSALRGSMRARAISLLRSSSRMS